MLSKNLYLTPAETNQILEENALPLSTSKDNTFGSGRVDALAAVNATFSPDIPPGQVINPYPSENATSVSPASLILEWQNGSGAPADYYQISIGTDNPPTNIVYDNVIVEPQFETVQLFENETTYYWKVNAYNEFGYSEGEIWSFSTLAYADEDFECGDFSLFPWEFSGHTEWHISTDTAASGAYSVKSGFVNAFENSSLSIQINVVESGNIIFWKKVSSEENNDKLRFYINNYIAGDWSGEIDWSQEEFYLEAGQYELMWKYQKFDYVTSGEDCAWIDYIIFPEIGEFFPPVLDINITEITHEMNLNAVNMIPFQISNLGGGELTYSLSLSYQSEQTGWLGLNMVAGDLAENESDEIEVSFYTYSITDGTYHATITIQSNVNEPVEIPIQLTVLPTSSEITEIPMKTALQANFPNPFNPVTTISYSLSETEPIKINIYNSKGQIVRALVHEMKPAGFHQVEWNGLDEQNHPVASGIYLYQLKTKNINQIKKMIMLK
jgi:hypothetical protein